MTLSPEQLRAARGLLNISQDELAKQAGVAITSIRQYELGNTASLQQKTLNALMAFFAEKLEFIGDRGVALRERGHLVLEGVHAKEFLLDDISKHHQGKELLVLCGNTTSPQFHTQSFCEALREKGYTTRCICQTKDCPFPIKTFPVPFDPSVLQIVYGSTVAQMVAPEKILLTRSNMLSEGLAQIFELLWSMLPDEDGENGGNQPSAEKKKAG